MAELINIRVYGTDGNPDSSLAPSLSIYDNADNSLVDTWVAIYDNVVKQYQYLFTWFDSSKTYTVNVDYGAWAITRYNSFWLSGDSWLTLEEHIQLMKWLTVPKFIALKD